MNKKKKSPKGEAKRKKRMPCTKSQDTDSSCDETTRHHHILFASKVQSPNVAHSPISNTTSLGYCCLASTVWGREGGVYTRGSARWLLGHAASRLRRLTSQHEGKWLGYTTRGLRAEIFFFQRHQSKDCGLCGWVLHAAVASLSVGFMGFLTTKNESKQ